MIKRWYGTAPIKGETELMLERIAECLVRRINIDGVIYLILKDFLTALGIASAPKNLPKIYAQQTDCTNNEAIIVDYYKHWKYQVRVISVDDAYKFVLDKQAKARKQEVRDNAYDAEIYLEEMTYEQEALRNSENEKAGEKKVEYDFPKKYDVDVLELMVSRQAHIDAMRNMKGKDEFFTHCDDWEYGDSKCELYKGFEIGLEGFTCEKCPYSCRTIVDCEWSEIYRNHHRYKKMYDMWIKEIKKHKKRNPHMYY